MFLSFFFFHCLVFPGLFLIRIERIGKSVFNTLGFISPGFVSFCFLVFGFFGEGGGLVFLDKFLHKYRGSTKNLEWPDLVSLFIN